MYEFRIFLHYISDRGAQFRVGGGGGAWLRAEGAIHREKSERVSSENFENWNFGNTISCNLVINFQLQFWALCRIW